MISGTGLAADYLQQAILGMIMFILLSNWMVLVVGSFKVDKLAENTFSWEMHQTAQFFTL